ncbi:hypothetical protein KST87_07010 [Fusobacterium nucleatum]|jgi:hypothetical protein|uniref:hypothetical protein n=1 Tax=Fusobacterium nucleatum TaxID=851 RepID=UPI0030D05BB7
MATLKNDKEKDKSAVTETTETTNNTEINVNAETSDTEAVTHNQVTTEIKAEKKEDKTDKTYIYIGEELTKDGFILKHKGFYTSEQLKRIETGISDYDEIKENFIDLDEYSENR